MRDKKWPGFLWQCAQKSRLCQQMLVSAAVLNGFVFLPVKLPEGADNQKYRDSEG